MAACISAVRLAFAFRQEFGHDVADRPDRLPPLRPQRGRRARVHAARDGGQDQAARAPVREHLRRPARRAGRRHPGGGRRASRRRSGTTSPQRHRELKAELAAADARAADGRLPARPLALARGQDRGLRRARCSRSTRSCCGSPRASRSTRSSSSSSSAGARRVGADGGIDWAQAEALAFASLLTEGTPIRLTGQDAERGTFSQRHLVLHDAKTGPARLARSSRLPGALAPMELHNSPLSRDRLPRLRVRLLDGGARDARAVGGAVRRLRQLARRSSSTSSSSPRLAKWGQTTRLTLLLPHGYEGSGPEHSSARLERFLQLAAEGNIRVANLTTPAQYFHLLRRQARVAKQRPLVIMTPKSLLRLPQATTRIEHLSESRFFPVLARAARSTRTRSRASCSAPARSTTTSWATRRARTTRASRSAASSCSTRSRRSRSSSEVERYPNLREVVWVQEEPRNMGARAHMSPRLLQILPEPARVRLRRPARARRRRARATRPPTRWSRTASSAPRWTSRSRSRSTRPSSRASAEPRLVNVALQG